MPEMPIRRLNRKRFTDFMRQDLVFSQNLEISAGTLQFLSLCHRLGDDLAILTKKEGW